MANTSFLFLLSSLKIDRKMTQQIGGELFFSFLVFTQIRPKNISTKRRKPFVKSGLHLKNWIIYRTYGSYQTQG